MERRWNGYAQLSDDDLGAIFGYLGTVPPVDRVIPARRLTFMGTVHFGTVGYETLSVARVDHGTGPVGLRPRGSASSTVAT